MERETRNEGDIIIKDKNKLCTNIISIPLASLVY